MIYLLLFMLGMCWGSFLNSVAWRLVNGSLFVSPFSYCPACHHYIRWYDLIPGISWLLLRGTCRFCHEPISPLYPVIEIATGILTVIAYMRLPISSLGWYGIYASLLIITVHTDARLYRISPWVTLYAVPLGIFSAYTMIPHITITESVITTISAYSLFAGLNYIYHRMHGFQAIGEGDWELIACIASFIGAEGTAYILCGGSALTILIALYAAYQDTLSTRTPLPFGACLATAAIAYPLIMHM